MIIKYVDEIEFYNGIHELVKRGIQFEADFSKLEIKLTGGF